MRTQIIGTIESCFREKFATPRQAAFVPEAPARLRILPEFLPQHSLDGLAEFSHVWLLFPFHLNSPRDFGPKVHPPRLQGKTIGVFASRSPHRPTPIGLSLAKLVRIEGDTLHLQGVDLVSGTPIVDIKPYVPASDRPARCRAGWTGRIPAGRLKVVFAPSALKDLERVVEPRIRSQVKALICRTLSYDPRNPRDRSQFKPGKELGFFFLYYDIHFKISGRRAEILWIQKARENDRRRPPLKEALL